jgi:tetratricopeptide (TPR) repeat protein
MRNLILSVAAVVLFLSFPGCRSEDPEVRFKSLMEKAQQYKKEEKWNEARLSLLSAIESKPKSDQAYFELAEVYINLKQIPQAVESYQTTLNYNPKHRNARLHLAAILLAARQYERAESEFAKVLEQDPNDSDALVLKANLLASSGRNDLEGAKQILEGVLAREPKHSATLASLADVFSKQNDLKRAEELYSQALELEPKSAPVKLAIADLYARQGRVDEAQQMLENLVTTYPDNPSLRMLLGEFMLGRGQMGKALEQYEETLKTDPLRHDARDKLYDMYLARKDLGVDSQKKARELTQGLIKTAPDNPIRNYFEGRDLELDGKLEQALDKYIKAIELAANFQPAFRRAGLIELHLTKDSAAVEHLSQAVALYPADVAARLGLARHYLAKNELGQASEHVQKILQIYPRQLGASVLRADIALLQGDAPAARGVYETLIKAFPGSPIGYYKTALLEEQQKNYERAIELYLKVIEFDREVLAPGKRLARLMLVQFGPQEAARRLDELKAKSKSSQPEWKVIIASLKMAQIKKNPAAAAEARTLLQEAAAERPNLYDAYLGLALLDSKDGKPSEAAKNYERILKDHPDRSPLRMMLAMTYEQMGEFNKAAEEYRQILTREPHFGPAANNLAWLISDKLKGDLEEALKLAQTAKEEMPKVGSVADTLGWIYHLRGSSAVAIGLLEEAVDAEKQVSADGKVNPEILYHLAEVKFALGDKAGAKQAADQALADGGPAMQNHDRLKALLAKLS